MDVIITSAQLNNVSITCDKPNIIYVVGAQPVNVTISFNIPNQSSSQSLKQTLLFGNETDGENIVVNDDDAVQLENGSLLKKGTYDFGANGGISRICGVGFEDMWQSGIRHVFDSNGFIRNSTNCFDIVPDANFDITLRFKIGSIWTLDDGSSYICTDASLGAAVWESFNLTATDIDALKRDGSNANQDIDLGVYSIKAREIVTQTNGQGMGMSLRSSNLTSEKFAEWQDKDYTGIADLQDVVDAILALKDGVDLSGDTLQKLYNLILGATAEAYVADIAERDAYNIQHLPFSIFVIDDGDGKWAKYQATTTGVGANFVKLSDPDLLNAVMSAAAIKAAYESNSDTNAFTNALKTKLDGIDLSQYLLVSNISNILTGTSTTKALSEAQGKALKDLVDTKQQTITDVILAQIISSLNTKTTLANNDSFPINDTAAGTPPAKRVSFTSLKAFLKTYFDTLYQNSLGFNAENIANKQNSLVVDGTGVKYPTVDAVFDALALKVDKVIGKVLSTNDFTNILKTKLDGIADGAEVNVNADWNAVSGDAQILNKPTIPSITNLVPYTGANANVDLGEFELKAGQITLDTTPTGTAAVTTTRWNDSSGSTETTLKGGNVILKNGVDLVARIVNKVTPNTTLTKAAYQVVRISGAQGQRLAVNLAQANNDLNSADTLGIVCETIATNQEGFIITVGQLEGINTTGSLQSETWADGDVLYLSPTTAGRITNIKPTGATGHIVVIGYVEYAHANNGKIYVKIMNGWELDELHNVFIDTPLNNQALTYETSTDLWKNKTIIEDSITNGVTDKAPSQNAVFDAYGGLGSRINQNYVISAAFSGLSPNDNTTYYIGPSSGIVAITETSRRWQFPYVTTIRTLSIALGQTTAGTSEAVSVYLRNSTAGTETLVGTFTSNFTAGTAAFFNFSGLNIAIPNTTDNWTLKIVTPTWATNPVAWTGSFFLIAN